MGDFPYAFKQSLPVVAAYFPLGIVFGVLFVNQGYSWYMAPLMSAFVYAGAVQFVALTMMENHATIWGIVLATSFVAFRNSFYGISFLARFSLAKPLHKAMLIFGLVDGSYAIFEANPNESLNFCSLVTIILYLSWLLGTLIGALCADWIPDVQGLDFVLPAFFMVLTVDFFIKRKAWAPILFPIITSFVCYILVPDYYFLMAIISSFVFIIYLYYRPSWNK